MDSFCSTSGVRRLSSLVVVGSLLTCCASADSRPLDSRAVVETVTARSAVEPAVLQAAIDSYDLEPLGLDRDALMAGLDDPRSDAYWHARALAWGAGVRPAFGEWRAALARARGAGSPDGVRIGYGIDDFDDSSLENQVSATIDVIRLLGLGPADAEEDAAKSRVALTLGHLEETLWQAVFAVDRARVRLDAARRREQTIAHLLAAARKDGRRIELLAARGRVAPGLVGRVEAVLARLERERTEMAAAAVRAEAVLAQAAGLVPGALALSASPAPDAMPGCPTVGDVQPEELLDRVPALRSARQAYALEEARVRVACASWWPGLRVGPRVKIRPDDFLTGGIVSLDLPWPSAVRAEVDAAKERRTAAREALEDALASTWADVDGYRREAMLAQEIERRDVEPMAQGSARAWRGARARLSVLEGLDALELWLDALQLRANGAVAAIDARERTWLATLRFRESAGRTPGLGGAR